MDTSLKNPLVSVVMPVLNGEWYIFDAIESILSQTLKELELIIVYDEGSRDQSLKVIRSFKDPRIVLIRIEKNAGIAAARNRGLKAARAEFIAWLDADDIAHRDRLKIQTAFLLEHPDCGLLGSAVRVIDEHGEPTGVLWKEQVSSEKLPMRLVFGNCLAQSSVMLRRSILPDPCYTEDSAEDFELWVRLLAHTNGALQKSVLVDYRIHAGNVTNSMRPRQQEVVNQVITAELEKIGVTPSAEELALHRKNYGHSGEDVFAFLDRREKWLERLREANKHTHRFNQKLFDETLAERYLASCSANSRKGLALWRRYWASDLARSINIKETYREVLKFGVKTLLRRESLRV